MIRMGKLYTQTIKKVVEKILNHAISNSYKNSTIYISAKKVKRELIFEVKNALYEAMAEERFQRAFNKEYS